MNAEYKSAFPPDLAEMLDAKAVADSWTWQDVYKFALWLWFVAIEDKGGLRKAANALGYAPGEWPEAVGGDKLLWRRMNIPREARDLVDMAERERVPWQTAQRLALMAGFATIEARGGLEATKRQAEALRRSVVTLSGAPAGAAGDRARG